MIYNNTCQDPFEFIKDIKQRYRKGLTLGSPDLMERSLAAEDLLNWDVDLGACNNPIVLALVACRDPMVTMSMAAASRLGPMTVNHKLMSGIFTIVGEVTKHRDVKECIGLVVKDKFSESGVSSLRKQVISKIYHKRQFYRQKIKGNLQSLIDGTISPAKFVDQLFIGLNQLNLKNHAYAKMVVDFLLSRKFRPKVKILMLENLYKMPRDVRMQVMMDMCEAPKIGHNEAIRDELICVLQEEPHLLAEPANANYEDSFIKPYPRSAKQRADDMNDQAFKTAEEVLS